MTEEVESKEKEQIRKVKEKTTDEICRQINEKHREINR